MASAATAFRNQVRSASRTLTALGSSVAEAQNAAYTLADQISWLGEFHRNDIGWRAIERERG